ncbi:hypothetical protein NMY22_g15062 [Coprinellus aureogranulatus]|nr:hypothetical protein NMY22_g15062 [Coprinellus aureogranulatus]
MPKRPLKERLGRGWNKTVDLFRRSRSPSPTPRPHAKLDVDHDAQQDRSQNALRTAGDRDDETVVPPLPALPLSGPSQVPQIIVIKALPFLIPEVPCIPEATPVIRPPQLSMASRSRLGPLAGHVKQVDSVHVALIAWGAKDKTIRLWDAQTGKLMSYALIGHSGAVSSVAFSPDGSKIVSGYDDRTIRVWATQRGRTALGTISLHHYPTPSFSMDDAGWVRNASDDLLLWVPPRFRHSMCFSSTELIIPGGYTKVELTHAIHHGTSWKRCIEPHSQGRERNSLPWPTTTSLEANDTS